MLHRHAWTLVLAAVGCLPATGSDLATPDDADASGEPNEGGAPEAPIAAVGGQGGGSEMDGEPATSGFAHAPSATTTGEITPSETLSIFAVDIGQGDATVVLGPFLGGRRRALVMDAGNRHPNGGQIVRDLLEAEGITSLDYVVLSHFDGDHIGGFVTISGSTSLLWQDASCTPTAFFPLTAIFDQGTDTNETASSNEWKTCVPGLAADFNTEHVAVEGGAAIGRELDLGGSYVATIVAGDGYVIDDPVRVPSVNTPNERSIALLVSHPAGFDFLVTGDLIGRAAGAENAAVEAALGAALSARGVGVEVLRVGHHGAANASDPTFLISVSPDVAIISTGDDQPTSYQHPRCASYQSLAEAGVPLVLQTELGYSDCADSPPVQPVVANGTLRIDVTGASYQVTSYGLASPANGGPTQPLAYNCSVLAGCSP